MNIYRLKAKIITFFCCLLLSQTVVFAQNAKKISIKKRKSLFERGIDRN